MPRFFFDYRDGDGHLQRDDEGIEFPTLGAAHKDALKAAVDMHADACRDGAGLASHSFEIRDVSGQVLLVLPFMEAILRRR